MMNKLMKLFLLFLSFPLLVLLTPAHTVLADTGPKPTMEFTFNGDQVTITSGILYECGKPDCSDASPLKELGPQRFTCDALSCSALAYGFSDYHKLEITFSDGKTRQSNIFRTAGFDSKYTVTIQPDGLLVEAQFSLLPSSPVSFGVTGIILACFCALVVVALIVGVVLFFIRRSRKQ